MEELKRIQEMHDAKERELKEERQRTETELKNFLEKQIELAKCKEEQEKILKREEVETIKAQEELEKMIEERNKLEEKRKQIDLRFV